MSTLTKASPLIDPIYIGEDATSQVLEYLQRKQLKRVYIVADTNTYKALGEHVESTLKSAKIEVSSIVLKGQEIHADEHYLIEVLINAPLGSCTFIAVGSGSITDIVRLVSHRSGRDFISMPTAPSVDGFNSLGAPIILSGVKTTLLCQAPIALFADLQVLCEAPQRLVAAGFGDMLGKITSLADWELGSLLWNEPYDLSIEHRSRKAIKQVEENVAAIASRSETGVRALMDALIESGFCMLEFGTSRPASGAEHHLSHYWEMKRLEEKRETYLHGAQVGYALTLVAKQYERIRALSQSDVAELLEKSKWLSREEQLADIRVGYGDMADDVAKEQKEFLALDEAGFTKLKRSILTNWPKIQAVADKVPPASRLIKMLEQVGGPASYQTLGLSLDEVNQGINYGHYLRNRFTVTKLSRALGLDFSVEK